MVWFELGFVGRVEVRGKLQFSKSVGLGSWLGLDFVGDHVNTMLLSFAASASVCVCASACGRVLLCVCCSFGLRGLGF